MCKNILPPQTYQIDSFFTLFFSSESRIISRMRNLIVEGGRETSLGRVGRDRSIVNSLYLYSNLPV